MSRRIVKILMDGNTYQSPLSFGIEKNSISGCVYLTISSNCCYSLVSIRHDNPSDKYVVSCSSCLSIVDSFGEGSKKYFTAAGIPMKYLDDYSDERLTLWAQVWSGLGFISIEKDKSK